MLNGVMLPWFLLTAAAVAFVVIDIRSTPESPVLKWGFVLLTAYAGPLGAFLYVLGFGFGWTIFQALFMRDMAGGSYSRSLASTFMPELLSMNFLMAGMMPVATLGRTLLRLHPGPATPEFWFVMSMALTAGFVVAFPVNWWLVATGLKHGMMTVRPRAEPQEMPMAMPEPQGHDAGHGPPPSTLAVAGMTALSIAAFVLAIGFARAFMAQH